MSQLLRHVPTGDLYPYNENLIRRDDMVEYVPPPEGGVDKPKEVAVEEEVVIKPTSKTKAAKESDSSLPNLDDL